MRRLLPAVVLLASSSLLVAQEREVPKDSTRITIPGCAKGRTFVVAERPEHEPTSGDLAPGRRFRLSGPRAVLNDIKIREGAMIEVTGLVRKADLEGPGGLTVGSGRVRIGGGAPQAPLGANPARSQQGVTTDAVLDIEGWTRLPESCPSR